MYRAVLSRRICFGTCALQPVSKIVADCILLLSPPPLCMGRAASCFDLNFCFARLLIGNYSRELCQRPNSRDQTVYFIPIRCGTLNITASPFCLVFDIPT